MRKYQKLVLALSLVLTVVHVIDAAPRNRRRARRAAQNSVTRSYSSNNATVQQPMLQQATMQQAVFQQPTIQHIATPSSYTVMQPSQALPAQSHATLNEVPTATVATAAVPVDATVSKTEPRTLDVGDALPIDPATKVNTTIARASYEMPVSTASIPSVGVVSYAQLQPVMQSSPASPAMHYGGAIAEVNAIRARRGLPAFIEDASLSAVAQQKASIQANRGAMGHPGGSMGGARFEGVGMGREFTSCYLYSSGGQYAGAASVQGRNGQRYHCLLIR